MCLLSFCGMYYLERDIARAAGSAKPRLLTSDLMICAAVFGAASATRSNGILLSRT